LSHMRRWVPRRRCCSREVIRAESGTAANSAAVAPRKQGLKVNHREAAYEETSENTPAGCSAAPRGAAPHGGPSGPVMVGTLAGLGWGLLTVYLYASGKIFYLWSGLRGHRPGGGCFCWRRSSTDRFYGRAPGRARPMRSRRATTGARNVTSTRPSSRAAPASTSAASSSSSPSASDSRSPTAN